MDFEPESDQYIIEAMDRYSEYTKRMLVKSIAQRTQEIVEHSEGEDVVFDILNLLMHL